MPFVAVFTKAGQPTQVVRGEPAWMTPGDVCRHFGVQGLGEIQAFTPGGTGYRIEHGPYAGQTLFVACETTQSESRSIAYEVRWPGFEAGGPLLEQPIDT